MSHFRYREIQSDSYENNENKITQPTENSSPSPETPDASKDILGPESQSDNELNISGATDSDLNKEISNGGTADVDICAEELNKIETLEEQILESVQEPVSSDGENETAEKEPVTLSTYGGLTDVDVCAEELQSTLEEEEHTEGNEDVTVTNAGFIQDPVLAEQDVLDNPDELIPSGTETLEYLEQDVNKEFNGISYSEQKTASFVKEDEIGETGHLSEDVGYMTNALFDDAGPEIHKVEQLHLIKEAESVIVSDEVKTFDETNTDEIPLVVENQQANDILAAEAMSESLFVLEQANLVNRSSEDIPGLWDLEKASEVQDCKNVTDVNASSDEEDSQIDMKQDDDSQDIFETIPVEEQEGLVDTGLNPTDEDVVIDGTRTSGDEVQDTSETEKDNKALNASETQIDNLFYSTGTHEDKGTFAVPTSEETEQDMEVTYKQLATDSEEPTEKPETDPDYQESQHQEDMVHETVPESENKEVR